MHLLFYNLSFLFLNFFSLGFFEYFSYSGYQFLVWSVVFKYFLYCVDCYLLNKETICLLQCHFSIFALASSGFSFLGVGCLFHFIYFLKFTEECCPFQSTKQFYNFQLISNLVRICNLCLFLCILVYNGLGTLYWKCCHSSLCDLSTYIENILAIKVLDYF